MDVYPRIWLTRAFSGGHHSAIANQIRQGAGESECVCVLGLKEVSVGVFRRLRSIADEVQMNSSNELRQDLALTVDSAESIDSPLLHSACSVAWHRRHPHAHSSVPQLHPDSQLFSTCTATCPPPSLPPQTHPQRPSALDRSPRPRPTRPTSSRPSSRRTSRSSPSRTSLRTSQSKARRSPRSPRLATALVERRSVGFSHSAFRRVVFLSLARSCSQAEAQRRKSVAFLPGDW